MTTKDEALKALHEASLSIACLGADWTEHFEDESVTKNHRKWVLKDEEGLQKDLDHIQDQITILENYIDPYVPEEDSKWKTIINQREFFSSYVGFMKETILLSIKF